MSNTLSVFNPGNELLQLNVLVEVSVLPGKLRGLW